MSIYSDFLASFGNMSKHGLSQKAQGGIAPSKLICKLQGSKHCSNIPVGTMCYTS